VDAVESGFPICPPRQRDVSDHQSPGMPRSARLPGSPSEPAAGGPPAVFPLLEIGNSAIHGRGAFAATRIAAGVRIVEYVGEKIGKEESLRRCEAENEYIFELDEAFDLDGNVEWNPARFVNHSCSPNCEAEYDEGHIYIVALRDIAPNEELTFNYGFDLTDYRDHPCRCGAERCVGYIVAEEFHPLLRDRERVAGPAGPS
jgi:uncharacterized protein